MRQYPQYNHYWSAELYLVEPTAPKQVTIYNGISWGWKNEVVPEPTTVMGSGLGMTMMFGAWLNKKKRSKKA
ncbi:PEP-CTERM sorting domain-containing protein [Kamptonema formosum]|uniref:PEP-CTERM sorting domain-containing protein n=1 Tax=Kamptonema formosum TaxID=331992 RepID=UPI00034B5357|nr:PEP-CTERM sorting domain-containing protein [Oscillatoria sp. PCC 10802]